MTFTPSTYVNFDGIMRLSAAQFSALLEGLDWRRVHAIETTAPVQPS